MARREVEEEKNMKDMGSQPPELYQAATTRYEGADAPATAQCQPPRTALLYRLEAEESHCIGRLNRLRELKIHVEMLKDRECDVFLRLLDALNNRW